MKPTRTFLRTLTILVALSCAAGLHPASGVAAPAGPVVVEGDGLRVEIVPDPWSLRIVDRAGEVVLAEHPGTGPSAAGTVGFQTTLGGARKHRAGPTLPDDGQFGETDGRPSTGWFHATRAADITPEGDGLRLLLDTTDPTRQLELVVAPGGEGSMELQVEVVGPTADVEAVGVGFVAAADERFLGFGERNDEVGRTAGVVEHYVGEGPYQREEYPFLQPAVIPAWGARQRADATYFPIPWLLSDRGYGVLVGNDEVSNHRLRVDADDAWSVEVLATHLTLTVHAGPEPADALRRLTRDIGRQPHPAPWFYGPWFQPTTNFAATLEEQLAQLATLRDADAPVSAVEMVHRYLPCGQHRGQRDDYRRRATAFHDRGIALLGYINPLVCSTYEETFDRAVEEDALQQRADGEPYLFTSYVGGQDVPVELVGQLDLGTPAADAILAGELDMLTADGADGWMEDFGEYTPFDAHSSDGTSGDVLHNRFVRDYHCAAHDYSRRHDAVHGRFVRSGWTGSAACSPMVWSGDPTTAWGFDGLSSQVTSSLTAGLSGISMWSSDIGGFFALGLNELDEELLVRWLQFGAVSPTMRTRVDGVAVPDKDRPQIWHPAVLSHWRMYASLHQQLLPYLQAATAEYRRSGLPIMRHHVLTHPDVPELTGLDDQFMLGPELLAAPVVTEGARQRTLRLPPGDWIELARSWRFDPQGEGGFELVAPEVHAGDRDLTVDAPLEELPLFLRRGALLPLLSREVDTASEHGGGAGGVVRAVDREDQRELLAFPHAQTTASFGEDGEEISSTPGEDEWVLQFRQQRPRTWQVQATLSTLAEPFVPCTVSAEGTDLPEAAWSYDGSTQVLRMEVTVADGDVRVAGCEDAAAPEGDDLPLATTGSSFPAVGLALLAALGFLSFRRRTT